MYVVSDPIEKAEVCNAEICIDVGDECCNAVWKSDPRTHFSEPWASEVKKGFFDGGGGQLYSEREQFMRKHEYSAGGGLCAAPLFVHIF